MTENVPAAKRITALVKERLGLRTAGELAAAAGLPAHADHSNVRKWQRGEGGISFEYLMNMLSKAGLLQPEAQAAWQDIPREEAARVVDIQREAAGVRLAAAALETPGEGGDRVSPREPG